MNLAPSRCYAAVLGRFHFLILLIALCVPAAGLKAQTPGALDPSFESGTGNTNGVVGIAMPLADGKVLIAGSFTSVRGEMRNRIARLNSDGSLDKSFTPGSGANGAISSLALQSDGKVLIGGNFTSFDGTPRNHIARLNSDGSLDTSFTPGSGANGAISSLALQSDGKMLIAGNFSSFDGTPRSYIARLNADGSLDSGFDSASGANGGISSLAVQSDGKVLIGGWFTSFNGTVRNRIARLNADGFLDTGFNPGAGADGTISSLAVQSDGKVLIGGNFTYFNGTTRNRIARLNSDGSLDTGFDPGTGFGSGAGTDSNVESLAVQSDGKVLIGGWFTSFNSTTRNRIARLTADGSLDTSFDPGLGADSAIFSVAVQSDGKVLIGGWFTAFNGTPRSYLARLNADGSLDSDFDLASGANGGISSFAVQSDGKVLIGGWFTFFNGTVRSRIARLNADGSLDTSFDPGLGADNSIYSLALQSDGKVLIAGNFSSFNGTARNYIARLNTDGSLDTSFNAGSGANNAIRSLALQSDGKVLIGGMFTAFDGTVRRSIARLNADGSLDTSFNPGQGANNAINSLALQSDGKVLIGGNFTVFDRTARNRIARLNADGSLDTSFNPGQGANNAINSLAIQSDGKVLIGGDFTFCNITPRNRIARLNADGSVDTSFNPGQGANNVINSLALQSDGKVLIAGFFFSFNGTSWNRIVRLNADGTLDNTFNPGSGADSTIYSLAMQSDGKVLIGGSFALFNSTARSFLARLSNDTATQSLTVPSTNRVQWLRGGASPEAQEVRFELSTGDGSTWTGLGMGTRISGGWELTGLNLPISGRIRALARTLGSYYNGSSGLVETVQAYLIPAATTGTATNITHTSADLSGTVNPNGAETTVVFQTRKPGQLYTPAGRVVAAQSPVPAGTEPVLVSATKTGLQPGTTYEFNIVAENSAGAGTWSESFSFTTLPNTAPVAAERQIHAPPAGTPTTIFDVAQHTSDADGDSLTVSIVDGASAFGSASTDGQTVSFTSSGWVGSATVHLQVSDGFTTTPVQVVMNNVAPTALADTAKVRAGNSVAIPVLANDNDADDDTLAISSFTQGASGGSVSSQSGSLSYTASESFTGTDTFSYTINDGRGGSASASVTVKVTPATPLTSKLSGKGDAVPGAGEDPRIPEGSVWSSFGVPSINDSETVAFLGNVVGSSRFSGIFAGEATAPVLISRKGESAPGAGGALFASFREPLLSNAGEVAFLATLSGPGVRASSRQGLWKATPNAEGDGYTVQLLARAGDEPAGVAGARWKSFVSVLLHGEAADPSTRSIVVLATMVTGPGKVTAGNDLGLWRFDQNGAHLLLREGQPLEVRGVTSAIRSFVALSSVPGSPGHGRVSAAQGALIRAKLADGRSAILQADGQSLSVLAATGDEIEPGVSLSSLGIPAGDLADNSLANVTLKGTGVTSATNTAIALCSKEGLEGLTYRTGVTALPAGFPLAKPLRDPVSNASSQAFLATLSGAGVTKTTNTAIIWQDNGQPTTLARAGEEPAGVAGARWKSFTSIALPEERGPLFTATLRVGPGKVKSTNDVGLWSVDNLGALHLVAREGDPLEGRTLRNFTVLSAVSGSPAQRRSYNAQGALIYRAYFTDGSQALLKVQLP